MTGKPENEFWMVWNPAGRAPTYKHGNRGSAQREAERLAEANPGQSFYVLHAISRSSRPPAVLTVELGDDLPF